MKKILLLIIVSLVFMIGCALDEVVKTYSIYDIVDDSSLAFEIIGEWVGEDINKPCSIIFREDSHTLEMNGAFYPYIIEEAKVITQGCVSSLSGKQYFNLILFTIKESSTPFMTIQWGVSGKIVNLYKVN